MSWFSRKKEKVEKQIEAYDNAIEKVKYLAALMEATSKQLKDEVAKLKSIDTKIRKEVEDE